MSKFNFCRRCNKRWKHPKNLICLTVTLLVMVLFFKCNWNSRSSRIIGLQYLHKFLIIGNSWKCILFFFIYLLGQREDNKYFLFHFPKHRKLMLISNFDSRELGCLKIYATFQIQKYIGSAGALLPGKFLRVRKVFARNIFFTLHLTGTWCENHWNFWKASIWSGKCLDCLEGFWIFWKVSELSGMFLYCLESFRIVLHIYGLSVKFLYGL